MHSLTTPPLPKSHQWNGAVGLLLCIAAGGWCVIMDLSGVVLSPPKDTNTADIRIVHIFITLAKRTHAPTPLLLIYFNRPVNYCAFILSTDRFLNSPVELFELFIFRPPCNPNGGFKND